MVTKAEQQVYAEVLLRDRLIFWDRRISKRAMSVQEWLSLNPWVCAARSIDSQVSAQCSGAMERDHVHTHTGGTKGKRAETTMETLLILCHFHHQEGWATSHRPEIRTYIKEANERYRVFADRRGPA
jgi:hypothetical protein